MKWLFLVVAFVNLLQKSIGQISSNLNDENIGKFIIENIDYKSLNKCNPAGSSIILLSIKFNKNGTIRKIEKNTQADSAFIQETTRIFYETNGKWSKNFIKKIKNKRLLIPFLYTYFPCKKRGDTFIYDTKENCCNLLEMSISQNIDIENCISNFFNDLDLLYDFKNICIISKLIKIDFDDKIFE